jgi:hypothetical protein
MTAIYLDERCPACQGHHTLYSSDVDRDSDRSACEYRCPVTGQPVRFPAGDRWGRSGSRPDDAVLLHAAAG